MDMRTDVDLLIALLDEAPIVVDRRSNHAGPLCVKIIARWTDRSVQTISDYRVGKTNIPVSFWKRLLEHHFDRRILELICPDDILIEASTIDPNPADRPADFFRAAVESEARHAEKQGYIAEILADGRVDELDANSVQEYADAFQRHRQTDVALHRAIIAKYQKVIARKGAVL